MVALIVWLIFFVETLHVKMRAYLSFFYKFNSSDINSAGLIGTAQVLRKKVRKGRGGDSRIPK